MSPDLLKDKLSLLNDKDDIIGKDEYSTFTRILKDKGLISTKKVTIINEDELEREDNKENIARTSNSNTPS